MERIILKVFSKTPLMIFRPPSVSAPRDSTQICHCTSLLSLISASFNSSRYSLRLSNENRGSVYRMTITSDVRKWLLSNSLLSAARSLQIRYTSLTEKAKRKTRKLSRPTYLQSLCLPLNLHSNINIWS